MAHSKSQKRRRVRIPAQRKATTVERPTKASFPQEKKLAGLLVTHELEVALNECKNQVAEIVHDCHLKNRKFRDIEFDLEADKELCLHGLGPEDDPYTPSDVQRATQIFDKPSFFVEGADSNDIVQGKMGDCWFLSALSTMSTAKGLVEKFCVARDEQIGVYGFIFFRDNAWVVVIVDDLLYTSVPKFEELHANEQALYHFNKDIYNNLSRKSGQGLYFARSGTNGETWVPLIEKAYAKLHGNYASLSGGQSGEAIEDLTGGVNTFIPTKDILDPDAFWNNELLHTAQDRLFGCSFGKLDTTRSMNASATVHGLIGGHAYSVLRAVEHNGKRFVVIRNPWGKLEWTGPWSDGSKEWTEEWLPALRVLGHAFGNDGQFIMEYKDFLDSWEQIDRTLLFDSSWVMSSQWLKVTTRPIPTAWGFGDMSFTISLPAASDAVIVLSKLDDRYFKTISSNSMWSFDFVLFRKGQNKPLAISSRSAIKSRSVNAEVYLEAGDYVVHVRLDRATLTEYDDNFLESRALSRTLTEKAKGESIASNFNRSEAASHLAIPLTTLAGQDIEHLEAKAIAAAAALKKEEEVLQGHPQDPDSATLVNANIATEAKDEKNDVSDHSKDATPGKDVAGDGGDDSDNDNDSDTGAKKTDDNKPFDEPDPSESEVFIGLRVYTNKTSAVVGGQLRHEMAISFAGLAIDGADQDVS